MIALARTSRHARIPLYDETPDTIVGLLNTRTLLLQPGVELWEAVEFPSFVPESMNLLNLLEALQRQKRGLAIVVDEFGGVAGVISMEDILEYVVGEIRNEGEVPGFFSDRIGPGKWRASGNLRIDDFRREYPDLGEVSDVDTLGGLVLQLAEVVPSVGERFLFRGLRFTVKSADERNVRELHIEKIKDH
jgi:CBS domain containing-hemolysin-like protein